jgi:hypothetical protein
MGRNRCKSLVFSVFRHSLFSMELGAGLGHSSARSAMSIAQTALAPSKLRQERHGDERHKHRCGHPLSSEHAAPNGAWMIFRGSSSINMALLKELSRSPTPPKTARLPRKGAEIARKRSIPMPLASFAPLCGKFCRRRFDHGLHGFHRLPREKSPDP